MVNSPLIRPYLLGGGGVALGGYLRFPWKNIRPQPPAHVQEDILMNQPAFCISSWWLNRPIFKKSSDWIISPIFLVGWKLKKKHLKTTPQDMSLDIQNPPKLRFLLWTTKKKQYPKHQHLRRDSPGCLGCVVVFLWQEFIPGPPWQCGLFFCQHVQLSSAAFQPSSASSFPTKFGS